MSNIDTNDTNPFHKTISPEDDWREWLTLSIMKNETEKIVTNIRPKTLSEFNFWAAEKATRREIVAHSVSEAILEFSFARM